MAMPSLRRVTRKLAEQDLIGITNGNRLGCANMVAALA